MQAGSDAVTNLAALIARLATCLDYADGQGDHVLAALISTAHEAAMARLAQATIGP